MDEVKAVATPPLNESEFLELVIDLLRDRSLGETYTLAFSARARDCGLRREGK
jgi:hypothetical protein